MTKRLKSPGIHSVEVGGRLLRALAEQRTPMTLTALSMAAGMPTSKARRYMVGFLNIGLVEQDERSGQYAPGPLALTIGLAALAQVDIVRQSEEIVRELRDTINETVVLALPGDHGPVIVRREDSFRPVTLNIRIGSVLPEHSATGLVLRAWHGVGTSAGNERRLAAIREQGYAEVEGAMMAGIYGISAPVLDLGGRIQGMLTVTTHLEGLSDDRRTTLRRALLDAVGRFIVP